MNVKARGGRHVFLFVCAGTHLARDILDVGAGEFAAPPGVRRFLLLHLDRQHIILHIDCNGIFRSMKSKFINLHQTPATTTTTGSNHGFHRLAWSRKVGPMLMGELNFK